MPKNILLRSTGNGDIITPDEDNRDLEIAMSAAIGPEQFNINFVIPDDMDGKYAQHMTLQQQEDEVIVSFYELRVPVILKDSEVDPLRAKLKNEGMAARCVSRIIIPNSKFAKFAELMSRHVETKKE